MALAVKLIAAVVVIAALAVGGVWMLGSQQPSQAIHAHDRAIVVALRAKDPQGEIGDLGFGEAILWRGRAAFSLIGENPAQWSHFLIVRPDAVGVSQLASNPELADVYAAEVKLTQVPVFALGLLRAQHLLGITKREEVSPTGALDEMSGRREILPTKASVDAALAMDIEASITMMNFLAYFPDEAGDKAKGRANYRRYGAEAIKAVHAVGGQLLFAGTITRVLVEPKHAPHDGAVSHDWDDLAAMIYPDPLAIFAMEQNPDYVAALDYRDRSLERTEVIASVGR
ncbi:MAG: hypothetical protein AAFN48_01390 [Pseudomonadota bacterium]